jgi:hypothetical protein
MFKSRSVSPLPPPLPSGADKRATAISTSGGSMPVHSLPATGTIVAVVRCADPIDIKESPLSTFCSKLRVETPLDFGLILESRVVRCGKSLDLLVSGGIVCKSCIKAEVMGNTLAIRSLGYDLE